MNAFSPRLIALAVAAALAACSPAGENRGSEPPLAGAAIGGPFTLIDQNGRTVTERDFAGKYRIVYFGYTYCPDVCPTDLQKIGAAMKMLEASDPATAARIVPIFITVDPERDSPEVMEQFLASFGPRIVGLTGSPKAIDRVAREYAIYHQKRQSEGASEYLVDHGRATYLMGPDGKPIALLPTEQGPRAIVEEIERWVT